MSHMVMLVHDYHLPIGICELQIERADSAGDDEQLESS